MQSSLFASYNAGVARARAVEHAKLDVGWAKFHEALEKSHILEEWAVARSEAARREAGEIRMSAADEVEPILAKARAEAEGILAQAPAEAGETLVAVHCWIPLPWVLQILPWLERRQGARQSSSWTRLRPTPIASSPACSRNLRLERNGRPKCTPMRRALTLGQPA
jgi:hypothetical protein